VSEILQVVHGQLVASKVEQSILQHAAVAVAINDVSDCNR
jgi:hypothetical protein